MLALDEIDPKKAEYVEQLNYMGLAARYAELASATFETADEDWILPSVFWV